LASSWPRQAARSPGCVAQTRHRYRD
jgi:hypothetical protein